MPVAPGSMYGSWQSKLFNGALAGVITAGRFLPYIIHGTALYSSVGTLDYAARKLGIPTTLYDIGEKIGFTNFGKREKLRIGRKIKKNRRQYRVKRLFI